MPKERKAKKKKSPDGKNQTAKQGPDPQAPQDPQASQASQAPQASQVPDPVDGPPDIFDAEQGPDVAELEAQLAETKDRLLRAVAETENVRRRAQRDKTDALKYGIAAFARDMLGVVDNLARALDSERRDEEKQANENLGGEELLERFNNFITGVQMTETETLKALERVGIRKIVPLGEPFDPELHHALFEVEDLEAPAGTVMQVIEAGYVLHDRLLREAKVGVSKGGPKGVPESAPAAPEEGPEQQQSKK